MNTYYIILCAGDIPARHPRTLIKYIHLFSHSFWWIKKSRIRHKLWMYIEIPTWKTVPFRFLLSTRIFFCSFECVYLLADLHACESLMVFITPRASYTTSNVPTYTVRCSRICFRIFLVQNILRKIYVYPLNIYHMAYLIS